MSQMDLSSLGIDQAAIDALARANVRTLQDLQRADPEQAAMASGIPVERLRDWQRRARRLGVPQPRSPLARAWTTGVVLIIIAIVIGWALIAIGARRITNAKQIQTASESKLAIAVSYVAGEAMSQLRDARLAINKNNWGSAQIILSQVAEKVALMRQVAPTDEVDAVQRISDQLTRLQKSADEQSKDTIQQLDALETSFDALHQQG